MPVPICRLRVGIAPEEIEDRCARLWAEISAQRDDGPINKEYFKERVKEDIRRAMDAAFQAGRMFQAANPDL